MQGYSVNGYINSILRKTGKTLLVEGSTDQSVIARLKLHKGMELGSDQLGSIDTTDLIQDPSTSGMGRKEIIKKIISEIKKLPHPHINSVKDKFGALLDREWDDVDLNFHSNSNWSAPNQEAPYFITAGHSVENYFFRLDGIEAYLRQQFFNSLSQVFFNNLQARFHYIIAIATTYSVAMKNLSLLTRGCGVVTSQCVEWSNGKYMATDELSNAITTRNVALPNQFIASINESTDNYLQTYNTPEPGRWLCHGHLGEEAIWACIGNLALEFQASTEVANRIERGFKEVRFNHAIDFLSRETLRESVPLDVVIDWLVAAP